jgi:ferrochelatase
MLGPDAPIVDKLRVFFNHPFFIEVHAKKIQLALDSIAFAERSATSLVFSAHSIPLPMSSTCEYVSQLFEACRLVADAIDTKRWQLAYQSRSGPPSVPWLEPDISTVLRALRSQGDKNVVISPIGFVSDHMEVIYDLDTEAKQLSQDIGLHMVRASTPGHDPLFIAMLGDLVEERLSDQPHRKAIGRMIASHDVCPPNCCNSHGRSL